MLQHLDFINSISDVLRKTGPEKNTLDKLTEKSDTGYATVSNYTPQAKYTYLYN